VAIELIDRGPGPPARQALARVVGAAKASDPLAPVTVVVATNAVGVASRRFLARDRGGIAGLDMVTIFRLAERLGAPRLAQAGRRPVSTAVLTAAVRAALASEPGLFAGIAEHPATERNIVRVHRELSELDDRQLATLAAQSPRSAAVIAIHHSVRSRLGPAWYGEHDLVDAAVTSLEAEPQQAAALGTVVWHLPDRLSAGQGRLGQAISRVAPSFAVVGLTGDPEADRPIHTTLRHLGVAPDPGGSPTDPARRVTPADVRSISVTDPDEEVRTAVRELVGRAATGTPLDRMALLFPREVPYQRLAHDQLIAADLPFHSVRGQPLAATVLAQRLLRFLALKDDDYARPAVLGLLCGDPTGDRTAEWETQSRAAGIVDGAAAWTDRLEAHADALRLRARSVGESKADGLQQAADHAAELSAAAVSLIEALEQGAGLTRWTDLAAWCTAAMTQHLASETERASWPETEAAAATQLTAVIQRLGALDAIDPVPTFLAFRRTVELELAERRIPHGRVGEGLLVGPLASALGIELDLAMVVGMAEGVIPATPTDDSVLPDRERSSVGEAMALRADGARLQHRDFLVAMAEAAELILVRPRSDLRRTLELPPSRWIPADAPAADIGSFIGGIATTRTHAHAQDWTLRQLLREGDADRPQESGRLDDLFEDPALRRAADLVDARHSGRFTRFDGNLAHLPMPSPLDQPQSATRLQAWAVCPHAYLMQHVLHVTPIEEPETIEEVSALRSGTLSHEILDRFVRSHLDRPAGQAWPPSAHAEIQALADQVFAEAEAQGGTGRAAQWSRYRARVRRELEEFLQRDTERMTTEHLAPTATELPFGLSDEDQPALPVPLGPDRRLLVRGAIDRIDRATDGRLVVTDYKTGRRQAYKDLDETNPHDHGVHLQLPLYGLAAQRWEGEPVAIDVRYWFVTEKGGFQDVGYRLTPEALDDSLGAIDRIVTGIEQGLFPAHPQQPVSYQHFVPCEFCDPDGLGTKDGYQRWLRIRQHPELTLYLDLIEPPELALDV
jgi:RecB family exonuclease